METHRFDCTQSELSCAISLADIFGFSPQGAKWTVPFNEAVMERDRSKRPRADLTWVHMFRSVCVDEDEAYEMAQALRKADLWLQEQPEDWPAWIDKGKRIWDWDRIWQGIFRAGFTGLLLRLVSFMEGGGFKFLKYGERDEMAALVDCDHPGFPVPPPKSPDTTSPPAFLKHFIPNADATLPGLDETD